MYAISGLVVGILITAIAAFFRFRALRVRDRAARDVTLAVIRSEAETKDRELAAMADRLQQQTCSPSATNLAVRVAEATLRAGSESLTEQVQNLEARLDAATKAADELRGDNARHREQISHLQTSLAEQEKQSKEKLELLEQTRERLNTEFRHLANEIFDNKQKSFREQSQAQLDGLLKPLRERIKDFEKRVETSYNNESKERHSLIREVAAACRK
ncbi:MAG: hypothetical protein U5O39_20670 [Gammaproteobacteria bacterium]|nr:hypothetical protein [Gammaproteobacteria bacterium]